MTQILLTEKSFHKIMNDIDNRLFVKEIKETEKIDVAIACSMVRLELAMELHKELFGGKENDRKQNGNN